MARLERHGYHGGPGMSDRLLELKALAFDIIRERDALQRQVSERGAQLAACAEAIAQLEAQVFGTAQAEPATGEQLRPPPPEALPE